MLQEIKGSVLYVSSFFPLVLYIAVFAWGLISEIQQLDTACAWQGIELTGCLDIPDSWLSARRNDLPGVLYPASARKTARMRKP